MSEATASGLEGVVAAETKISHVDGERGRLVIAGDDVEHLAITATFEQAAARVLSAGGLPIEAAELRNMLGRARMTAWDHVGQLGNALDAVDGMEALRAAFGHEWSSGNDRADAISAIAAFPVLVAAWSRTRRGLARIAPSFEHDHATDYLRMTLGEEPSATAAKALGAYLVTVMDHGMNASTFTARVVTSTASDLISAVVAAIGALKGPLHGGAPGPVLDMLDAIGSADAADPIGSMTRGGSPANAETWLLAELAAGQRIMGMGHRIYRVRDPRAAVLETAVKPLAASGRLELARAVETAAAKILRERKPDRPLAANVEFYTAVLLDAIGLPRDQFSTTFAVGRVAGWCAHVIEQRRIGKLIRPASTYIGPLPG